MSQKFNLEQIREYWQSQAKQYGQSPSASWSDFPVIEMEIKGFVRYLDDDDKVLDVGCANGYTTIQLAAARNILIHGLDYVPEMIEQARSRIGSLPASLANRISFDTGDITSLAEPDGAYDKVVVSRVVINLASWERQVVALEQCARTLRPGGSLLLSEATLQGWQRLNKFRQEWHLEPIPMPPFNLYLDQDKVIDAMADTLELVELVDFSSTYYVATRVIKPLLIAALGADIDVGDPRMEWNRFFSQLPSCSDYGVQKLFVFRKRV